jgi:hypothetical protein
MSSDPASEIKFEIGHVLFIDIVARSGTILPGFPAAMICRGF